MKNQHENPEEARQYYYPVRDPNNPRRVTLEPIPEPLYRELMPDIWKTQKRMQRSGQCVCPRNKLWTCDADCLICPYCVAGETVSLSTTSDETEELTLEDTIANDDPSPESIALDRALLAALRAELDALDAEERRMCELLMRSSEREAAKQMGLSRSAFKRRWSKLRAALADKLRDLYK